VVGAGIELCVVGLFPLAPAGVIRQTTGTIIAFVGIFLMLEFLPGSAQDALQRFRRSWCRQ
jgi:hypothetical protein